MIAAGRTNWLGAIRHSCSIVAAALACGMAASEPRAADPSENGDLKKLAGVWHLVGEEYKGQPRPRQDVLDSKGTLTVTGDKFVFETQLPDGGKAAHTGTAVLDETARPRRFDWTGTGPKGAALERVGLYELTDEEFKLVFVQRRTKKEGPLPRPTAFATAEENNNVILTFRRKPPGAVAGDTPVTPRPEAKSAKPPAKVPPSVRIAPAHVLQTTFVHRVEAVLTTEIRFPNLTAEEWEVVAPRLPELPSQRKVSTVMDPAGKPGEDLSDLKRPVLSARVPVRGQALKTALKIRTTYQADLMARQLVPLGPGVRPPAVKDLTDGERKLALTATGFFDFDEKPFQDWLDKQDLRRRAKESDVDLAIRVFQTIRKNCRYEARAGMDHHASHVCKVGKSECGGLSILFVSALRANGVPARVLVGRWARPGDKNAPIQIDQLKIDDYGGQHATAEFFAYGVGWIPADMSAGVMHDKSAAGLEYFGRESGQFLTLHVDDDLVFDSVHFGRQTVATMQSPLAWAKGEGKHDGQERKETWDVRKVR